MHTTMTPLTFCQIPSCRKPIYLEHVISEKNVKNAPMHVVIVFECKHCHNRHRLVALQEVWEDYISRAFWEEDNHGAR